MPQFFKSNDLYSKMPKVEQGERVWIWLPSTPLDSKLKKKKKINQASIMGVLK